jgi:hypothetical protein
MKKSAARAFEKIAAELRRLQRAGDKQGCIRYMASDAYLTFLPQLSPADHGKVMSLIGEIWRAAGDRAAGDPKTPIPKYSTRGWRAWDEGRVARLKALWAKFGDDKAVARGLGISLKAAQRARLRYVGSYCYVAQPTEFRAAA